MIPTPKFAIGDFVTLESVAARARSDGTVPVLEVKGACIEVMTDYQGVYYWVRLFVGTGGQWARAIEFGIGPKLQTGEFRLQEMDLVPCPQAALDRVFGAKKEDEIK
jgi:hypothetical protein